MTTKQKEEWRITSGLSFSAVVGMNDFVKVVLPVGLVGFW